MRQRLSLLFLCSLLWLSCRDDDDRFERIDKLRGVGVKTATPIVVSPDANAPSQEVSLSFYLALPRDQEVLSAEFYEPDASPYTLSIIGTRTTEVSYQEHGALRIAQIDGRVSVPSFSAAQIAAARGLIRLRYGLRVTSENDREDMVGEVRVVASADDASLGWRAPTLSLDAPTENRYSPDAVDLRASLTKAQDESVKLIWFVSSGTVDNLQAASSVWRDMGEGEHTLLLAFYSQKSLFFDFIVKTITFESKT